MSVLKEKLGEAIASVHAVLISLAQEQAQPAPLPEDASLFAAFEDARRRMGEAVEVDCDCDKCAAEMVLAPILALLDQAHNTDDGEHYTALVNSARLTAHAMMRLVQE